MEDKWFWFGLVVVEVVVLVLIIFYDFDGSVKKFMGTEIIDVANSGTEIIDVANSDSDSPFDGFSQQCIQTTETIKERYIDSYVALDCVEKECKKMDSYDALVECAQSIVYDDIEIKYSSISDLLRIRLKCTIPANIENFTEKRCVKEGFVRDVDYLIKSD